MKKSLALFAATFLFANLQTEAQILKDVFGGKKEKAGETTTTTTTSVPETGANQYKMLEYFMTLKKVYPMKRSGSEVYYTGSETPELPSAMIQNIKADGNRGFMFNGVAEYVPNHPTEPTYFFRQDGADYFIFTDKYAFSLDRFDATSNTIVIFDNIYAYNKADADAVKSKKVNFAMISAEATAYLNAADVARKGAINKEEEAKRAQFSIKGKTVKSIRINSSENNLSQGDRYNFSIVATLDNGTEISTGGGGYQDDYNIEIIGLDATYPLLGSMRDNTLQNGVIIIATSGKPVAGDVLIVKATSKYDSKITTEKKVDITYDKNQNFDYGGILNGMITPTHGYSLRIEAKACKHAVTKANLIEYKIFDAFNNDLYHHFKITESAIVNVNVSGSKGWSAGKEKPAVNGSNAGNVKVLIDPAITSYNLNISANAGAGGLGDYGRPAGSPGTAGKVETVKQKPTW